MKIKASNRGLTFSFAENETFKAGVHYRYVVDTKASEVIIIPDEEGKYKFSKKGVMEKPLVDLRNEEIREAMSMARYMEVEIKEDKIIVHIIKNSANIDTLSEIELTQMIDRSEEVTFTIDKDTLKHNNDALAEMLEASGLTKNVSRDISYVFDTAALFCGSGMSTYPFAKDGSFDMVFAVDNNKAACDTYSENISTNVICKDIRTLDEKDVPNCELILTTPCCQGFSVENQKGNDSLNKKKRALTDDSIRIINHVKPWAFVMENVPTFLSAEDGKYLNAVLTNLSDNYNITYQILKDCELGGYTTRKRMILIGSQKNMKPIEFPDIVVTDKKTAGEALRKVNSSWFNYNDITQSHDWTKDKMSFVENGGNFKSINKLKALTNAHTNKYKRIDADKPAPTVVNPRKCCMMPPDKNRVLSVSEAAALMGLEKDFKFYGSLGQRQQMVADGVTQAMARFIKDIIKNAFYEYASRLTGLRTRFA